MASEHYCDVHGSKFFPHEKGGKKWYSHKIEGTDGYCNERVDEDKPEPKPKVYAEKTPPPASYSKPIDDSRQTSIELQGVIKEIGEDLRTMGEGKTPKHLVDFYWSYLTKRAYPPTSTVSAPVPPPETPTEPPVVAKEATVPEKPSQSIPPIGDKGLDIGWFKQELDYLVKAGKSEWMRDAVLVMLRTNYKVTGKTITELVSKLTTDQSSELMARVLTEHAKVESAKQVKQDEDLLF